ncbi:hypothetical protein KY289_026836 [Solanum tuberosum]|nr:hypothetical protein KY289_026836 [Solanum tuberosum]
MFHEFSEHQNGHSSVVTPPDNSTECSIPPTADFFHELSLMQPISSDLQQLGPSNTTPNSLVSVSNSTKSAPHAAATPDNQLYHSPNTLSPFTQLAANSLSLDQSVDVQDQTHTQQITNNTHHMLTRTKTHAMTNLTFHTLFIASIKPDIVEPKSLKTFVSRPHWLAVMHDELNALEINETWTLVPRQPDMNVIGSRWVFNTTQT